MNTAISLDDKYTAASGLAYMSGTHALVRLPMLQRERDAASGLDTAGFISGDHAPWREPRWMSQSCRMM